MMPTTGKCNSLLYLGWTSPICMLCLLVQWADKSKKVSGQEWEISLAKQCVSWGLQLSKNQPGLGIKFCSGSLNQAGRKTFTKEGVSSLSEEGFAATLSHASPFWATSGLCLFLSLLISGQHLRNHCRGHEIRLLQGGKVNGSQGGYGKSGWCLGWKGTLQCQDAGKGGNIHVALAGGRLGMPDTRRLQRLQSRGDASLCWVVSTLAWLTAPVLLLLAICPGFFSWFNHRHHI